jgi:ATP-dependent DNA helicase RecG
VLPFKLTAGQKSSLKEIVDDLQRPQPMNRLLQGDVGAGKTIVALLAALVAMENGLQVAFMAPTEILAEQHFLNISRLLSRLASAPRPDRQRTGGAAEDAGRRPGRNDRLGGRHARARRGDVTSGSRAGRHRRAAPLPACCSAKPPHEALHFDVLAATATPIPDAGADVNGDLDVWSSAICGRVPTWTSAKPNRAADVYAFVASLRRGPQVYVIYPLVEESEKVD